MKIAIGSDHAGFELKEHVKQHLAKNHEVMDQGTESKESCDYPVYAHAVAEKILGGEVDRGILICGTGIGMSIVGNRYRDLRAALCHDAFTAERARLHNDAQIMCMGSDVVGQDLAIEMIDIFLTTDFDRQDKANERHIRRIQEIDNT